MEDENRLELSLAPPCVAGTSAAKGNTGSSSDARSDISDRETKLINEFKQFLDGGTKPIGPGVASQMKPENFFSNLSNAPANAESSKNPNTGGFWIENDKQSEGNEGNGPDVRQKRKNVFGETSQQKKNEKESDHADVHDRSKVSHISLDTDDGSTAENEDIADSEADASISKPLLQSDEKARQCVGSILSDARKEFHGILNPVELHGQKRFTISTEKDFKLENVSQGGQFSHQPVNIMSMNQLNPAGVHIRPTYNLPGVMQVVAATNNERTGSLPVSPANLPIVAGYAPVTLPTLDKGIPPRASEFRHDGKGVDHTVSSAKHPVEGGSTTQSEDGLRGNNTTLRPRNATEQSRTEGIPSEYPTIKPGIAADLKFGGSGSYPNLPWVSTTGTGPHGRTISGVTYRYSPTQIRIVCACHGTHLSPEEFVQHASEEQANQDASIGVASVPTTNPAASAKS